MSLGVEVGGAPLKRSWWLGGWELHKDSLSSCLGIGKTRSRRALSTAWARPPRLHTDGGATSPGPHKLWSEKANQWICV